MKKRISLILAMLVLTACVSCQPTPEEEIVVNRGDKIMEEKISATVAPTASSGEPLPTETARAYTFPERWEEEYVASDQLTLRFEADITQREDGIYPVHSVREEVMTGERAQELLKLFLNAEPVSL